MIEAEAGTIIETRTVTMRDAPPAQTMPPARRAVLKEDTMATRFPVSSLAGDMVSLRSAIDRLFNESFVPSGMRPFWSSENGASQAALPLDVYATENEVVVLAAVPGMDPEDIHITIDKNTVTLSGRIPNAVDAEEAKGASWYLHELPYGSFERALTLPVALDAARAEATFEHGMLRLTLPKAESEKPKQIKVKVAGPSDEGQPAIEAKGQTSDKK
jgi:HSP20 family protein